MNCPHQPWFAYDSKRLRTRRLWILALLLSALPAGVQAQYTYTYTGPLQTIVDVRVPSAVNGLTVTSIGDLAFWSIALTPPPYGNLIWVTSATIPNTVTNIGKRAFYQSPILNRVTVGSGLIRIDDQAFSGCSNLRQILFQGNAPGLGTGVFLGANNATVYYLPGTTGWGPEFGGLPTMLMPAFDCATNNGTLTISGYNGPGGDVTIPGELYGMAVASIGDGAFDECDSLTNVVIAIGPTNIGAGAFSFCLNLASATLPDSVAYLGSFAFWHCSGLTNITLGDGVITLDSFAFASCGGLHSVILPDSLLSISNCAFQDCTSLCRLSIGKNVRDIGPQAFFGCVWLTNLTIPDRVSNLGSQAFYGCIGLTNVTFGVSIASIGDYAFYDCPGLKTPTFKGNAPRVGYAVFDLADDVTVYHLPGTAGWGSYLGGIPTALWLLPNPVILSFGPSFGVQTNEFGFVISWATNASVVVEASSNFVSATWLPLSTNTLVSGWSYFSDPKWTNYPTRFYRVRSP